MLQVVVFVACRRADPEGPRGPGASFRLPYTLEGVGYVFQFDSPAVEPPASIGELWMYVRFTRPTARGTSRRFGLRVFALNADDSRVPVRHPSGRAGVFDLGTVPFPAGQTVVSWTFPVRDLELPRRGRYELRLYARRRPTWRNRRPWKHLASHYLAVE